MNPSVCCMQLIAKDFMAAAAVPLHCSSLVLGPSSCVLALAGLFGRAMQKSTTAAAADRSRSHSSRRSSNGAMLKCCSCQAMRMGMWMGAGLVWNRVKCLLRLPCCHRRCRCAGTGTATATGALLWQNTSPHQQQLQHCISITCENCSTADLQFNGNLATR